ncbi:thioredoxin domain-containing protein [Candidatus Nomurabacteria bacterium]|nr:thioredoxin domain-containing protein [Candidatus Nomurabacteria bacterium]
MIKKHHFLIAFLPAIVLTGYLLMHILEQNYQEALVTQKAYTGQKNLDLVPIFPGDPLIGDVRANVTIIAFEDVGCMNCRQQNEFFNQLLEKYPNVFKIIWKGLAVTKYPYSSEKANEYLYCAHNQGKFERFKDMAFANNENLSTLVLDTLVESAGLDKEKLTACLAQGEGKAKLDEVEKLAREVNIQSVPTLFVNNRQLTLPNTLEAWEEFFELNP